MLLQGFLSVSAKMMSPLKDVLLLKKLQKNVKHAIEHNYKQQGGYLSIQRNPGSWALESVIIQLQESRIPLTIGIRNPSSIDKDWKPNTGIQNPEAKTVLDFLSWSEGHYWTFYSKN